MKKAVSIEPRARTVVMEKISTVCEVNVEEVMEELSSYVSYDIQELQRQALRRMATSIIRKRRDDDGVKEFFNCKNKEGSKYVNVGKTESIQDLDEIEKAINKQFSGIAKSKKKIARRQQILMGQVALDEIV